MIILKLGGSFVTYKKDDCTPPYRRNEISLRYRIRKDRLHRIAKTLNMYNDENMIMIHGGGTHGHRTMTRWKMRSDHCSEQMMAWEVKWRMDQLTFEISTVMGSEKVPTITVPTSSVVLSDDGSVFETDLKVVSRIIERGCIPLLRGDLVPDINGAWSVVSGDTLIADICRVWDKVDDPVNKVIMIADVEGFMDPVSGKLIDEVDQSGFKNNKDEWMSSLKKTEGDVSGGIWGKIITLRGIADMGIESYIIGGDGGDQLQRILSGKKAGTRFSPL